MPPTRPLGWAQPPAAAAPRAQAHRASGAGTRCSPRGAASAGTGRRAQAGRSSGSTSSGAPVLGLWGRAHVAGRRRTCSTQLGVWATAPDSGPALLGDLGPWTGHRLPRTLAGAAKPQGPELVAVAKGLAFLKGGAGSPCPQRAGAGGHDRRSGDPGGCCDGQGQSGGRGWKEDPHSPNLRQLYRGLIFRMLLLLIKDIWGT